MYTIPDYSISSMLQNYVGIIDTHCHLDFLINRTRFPSGQPQPNKMRFHNANTVLHHKLYAAKLCWHYRHAWSSVFSLQPYPYFLQLRTSFRFVPSFGEIGLDNTDRLVMRKDLQDASNI